MLLGGAGAEAAERGGDRRVLGTRSALMEVLSELAGGTQAAADSPAMGSGQGREGIPMAVPADPAP